MFSNVRVQLLLTACAENIEQKRMEFSSCFLHTSHQTLATKSVPNIFFDMREQKDMLVFLLEMKVFKTFLKVMCFVLSEIHL